MLSHAFHTFLRIGEITILEKGSPNPHLVHESQIVIQPEHSEHNFIAYTKTVIVRPFHYRSGKHTGTAHAQFVPSKLAYEYEAPGLAPYSSMPLVNAALSNDFNKARVAFHTILRVSRVLGDLLKQ